MPIIKKKIWPEYFEALADAVSGGKEYGSSLEDLERYFFDFALAARAKKGL